MNHRVIQPAGTLQVEAEFSADPLHGGVLGKNISDDAVKFLLARNIDEPTEQFGAEALPLLRIPDDECELGVTRPGKLRKTTDRRDTPPSVVILNLGHERHLTVVVDEADP